MTCVDAFSARRRKRAEERLPRLLDDIRKMVCGDPGNPKRSPEELALCKSLTS